MIDRVHSLPYRPCVGMMVINRHGLIWVGRRIDMPSDASGANDWWQMPQGGIGKGESPSQAGLRELREETGIRTVAIVGQTRDWLTYDLPDELIGVALGGRYRGQRQKWFAARFRGEDSEIDLAPAPGHKPEFEAWRWAAVDQLVASIVPFKREVYRAVVAELGPMAHPERW